MNERGWKKRWSTITAKSFSFTTLCRRRQSYDWLQSCLFSFLFPPLSLSFSPRGRSRTRALTRWSGGCQVISCTNNQLTGASCRDTSAQKMLTYLLKRSPRKYQWFTGPCPTRALQTSTPCHSCRNKNPHTNAKLNQLFAICQTWYVKYLEGTCLVLSFLLYLDISLRNTQRGYKVPCRYLSHLSANVISVS